MGAAIASSATQQDRLIRLDSNLGQLDIYAISKSEVRNVKDEAAASLKNYSIVQMNPFNKAKYQFNLKIAGRDHIQNLERSEFVRIKPEWLEKSIHVCLTDVSDCIPLTFPGHSILVNIVCKKGKLSTDIQSPKERQMFLKTVSLDYEVE